MRGLLGAAVAIGTWAARHRIIAAVAAFAVVMAAIGGGLFTASALGPSQTFDGDIAPGSHTWRFYGEYPFERGEIEPYMCNRCHEKIATDYGKDLDGDTVPDQPHGYDSDTGVGLDYCLDCHERSDDGHAARVSKCGDCHYGGPGYPIWWGNAAEELSQDAHASMLVDMGEDSDLSQASWTCKACHTYVEIDISETQMGPLEFNMGP